MGAGLPGAAEVGNAAWIERADLKDPRALLEARGQHALGAGELSTILLVKELQADIVFLDDHQARSLARREGLSIIGTVGLLEALYSRGYLPDLRDAFRKLLIEHAYIDQRLLDRRLKALGLLPL
jgi:predicted nucleic acid-binding protein